MGIGKKLSREIKNVMDNFFGFLTRKKKKNVTVIPRSWGKKQKERTRKKDFVEIQYKKKIPGLRQIKRFIAGFLLLINFVFSQFILGSIGSQAQPMFFLFLGNSFFLMDYLWKTRSQKNE